MSGSSVRGGDGRGGEAQDHRNNTIINLSVKGQDGRVIVFKIKRTTKLQKLLMAYCKKVQVEYRTLNFLYDGERFPKRKTPIDLHMEDGDEIEAYLPFGGGGNAH